VVALDTWAGMMGVCVGVVVSLLLHCYIHNGDAQTQRRKISVHATCPRNVVELFTDKLKTFKRYLTN